MNEQIKCILFDRDGTLGYLDDERFPTPFHLYGDVKGTFAKLKAKGYIVGVITNQSSIARGTAGAYDFGAELEGYGVDIWELCPHDNADMCNCRKPKSGLLLSACKRLGISPEQCFVVGDRMTDIQCAKNVGARAALVLTGKGQKEAELVKNTYPDVDIWQRFDDVLNWF